MKFRKEDLEGTLLKAGHRQLKLNSLGSVIHLSNEGESESLFVCFHTDLKNAYAVTLPLDEIDKKTLSSVGTGSTALLPTSSYL